MVVHAVAWKQVGKRFDTLGEHVAQHFDKVGADAAAERAAFEKSVRRMLATLEDGFTAAGKAVRDPVLRQDLTNVGVSVRDAVLTTVDNVGEQARVRLTPPKAPTKPVAPARKATARKTVPAKRTTGKAAPHRRVAS